MGGKRASNIDVLQWMNGIDTYCTHRNDKKQYLKGFTKTSSSPASLSIRSFFLCSGGRPASCYTRHRIFTKLNCLPGSTAPPPPHHPIRPVLYHPVCGTISFSSFFF